jgi:hypothetical protein
MSVLSFLHHKMNLDKTAERSGYICKPPRRVIDARQTCKLVLLVLSEYSLSATNTQNTMGIGHCVLRKELRALVNAVFANSWLRKLLL